MAAPLRPSSLLLAGLLLVVLLLLPLGARANSQTELNEDNDWEPTDLIDEVDSSSTQETAAADPVLRPTSINRAAGSSTAGAASGSPSSPPRQLRQRQVHFPRICLRNRGQRSRSNPRRFRRSALLQTETGNELSQAQAARMAHTRLNYEVELRPSVLVLDDMQHVLACSSVPLVSSSPLFAIRLLLNDTRSVVSDFLLNSVLHGSAEWNCSNPATEVTTILDDSSPAAALDLSSSSSSSSLLLARVAAVLVEDSSYVLLHLRPANLSDVFAHAQVDMEDVAAPLTAAVTAAAGEQQEEKTTVYTEEEKNIAGSLRVHKEFVHEFPHLFSTQPQNASDVRAIPHGGHRSTPLLSLETSGADSSASTSSPRSHRVISFGSLSGSVSGVREDYNYLPLNSVTLRWTIGATFQPSESVIITLYEDVLGPWNTPYLYRTARANDGAAGWQFPDGSYGANTPSSSNHFYFSIGWNCGSEWRAEKCGSYVYSPSFYLPPRGVKITSPSLFSLYSPTDTVYVSFERGSIATDKVIEFRLKQWGLLFDDDKTLRTTVNSNVFKVTCAYASCTLAMPLTNFQDVSASLRPYYIESRHSCVLGGWCTISRSPFFLVPAGTTGRWNTENDITAKSPLPIVSRSCASLECQSSQGTLSGLDEIICDQLCGEGRDVNMGVEADNTFLVYSVQANKFALTYDLSGLTSATVGASVNVKGTASLHAWLDFDAEASFNLPLLPRTPIPSAGINFNLGVIDVGIGFFVQIDALARLRMSGSGSVRASHSLSYASQVTLIYSDSRGWDVERWAVPTSTSSPTVTIDVQAEVSLEVGVKPTVGVQMSLFGAEASVSAEVYVRGDAAFQYPPFPALGAPYESPLTTNKALHHAGDCSTPHLLRYAVTAGIRNIDAEAEIDFNFGRSLGVSLLDGFKVQTYKSLEIPDPEPFSLVSGCLLHTTAETARKATFTIVLSVSSLQQTFSFHVVQDLAAALEVPPSRFVVAQTAATTLDRRATADAFHTMSAAAAAGAASGATRQWPQADSNSYDPHPLVSSRRVVSMSAGVAVTEVTVDILPSDDASAPTPSQLQQRLDAQLADSSSSLRRNGVVTKFIGGQLGPGGGENGGGVKDPDDDPDDPSNGDNGGSSSNSLPVIIGAVVGGVAAVSALLLLLIFVVRHRRRAAAEKASVYPNGTTARAAATATAAVAEIDEPAATSVEEGTSARGKQPAFGATEMVSLQAIGVVPSGKSERPKRASAIPEPLVLLEV